jgi:hypothetical protein
MPGPPPGAGVPAGSTAFVVLAVDVAATGEVAGAGDAAFEPNQECLAGLGDAAVTALAAGDASFLERLCLAGLAEAFKLAAGDPVVAAVAAGEASFLECLCLAAAGEGSELAAGDGDWATNEASENPVSAIIKPINFFITHKTSGGRTSVARPKWEVTRKIISFSRAGLRIPLFFADQKGKLGKLWTS